MARRRKTRGVRIDPVSVAVSRGVYQALDAQAYERAYEEILKDPDVQDAVDVLLDKMLAALRKRKNGRRTVARR